MLERRREGPITIIRCAQDVTAENLFALVPGRDPALADRLLVVEAFYDSGVNVAGKAPGADEACGIATLLAMARRLQQAPPARSVLLLATDAHDEALAGYATAIRHRSASTMWKAVRHRIGTLSMEALPSLLIPNFQTCRQADTM